MNKGKVNSMSDMEDKEQKKKVIRQPPPEKEKELLHHDDVRLFGPKNEQDLRRQYKELKDSPEFTQLTNKELLFTWWFACPTSPFVMNEYPTRERMDAAIGKSFGKMDAKMHAEYVALNFPERVRVAVEKMRSYRPDLRVRSKLMIEDIFNRFETMIQTSDNDFHKFDSEGSYVGIDWTAKKQYMDTMKMIAGELPGLVNQLEESFGIDIEENNEAVVRGTKAIDRYVRNKRET